MMSQGSAVTSLQPSSFPYFEGEGPTDWEFHNLYNHIKRRWVAPSPIPSKVEEVQDRFILMRPIDLYRGLAVTFIFGAGTNTSDKMENELQKYPVSIITKTGLFEPLIDQYECLRNATIQCPINEVEHEFQYIFNKEYDDIFEDGMDNELFKSVRFLIYQFGIRAINAIIRLIIYMLIPPKYAAEVLRAVSSINKDFLYNERLWLLERCLKNSSSKVRDAAAVGLATLEDSTSIPYLEDAIQSERNIDLRNDLQLVRDLLEQFRK
jgi:hypothetical protein